MQNRYVECDENLWRANRWELYLCYSLKLIKLSQMHLAPEVKIYNFRAQKCNQYQYELARSINVVKL